MPYPTQGPERSYLTLEEIGKLDTRFSDAVQKTLAVDSSVKGRAAVYKQALVAVSLNFGGAAAQVSAIVAREAMRGLDSQDKQAIQQAFNVPDRSTQTEAQFRQSLLFPLTS